VAGSGVQPVASANSTSVVRRNGIRANHRMTLCSGEHRQLVESVAIMVPGAFFVMGLILEISVTASFASRLILPGRFAAGRIFPGLP